MQAELKHRALILSKLSLKCIAPPARFSITNETNYLLSISLPSLFFFSQRRPIIRIARKRRNFRCVANVSRPTRFSSVSSDAPRHLFSSGRSSSFRDTGVETQILESNVCSLLPTDSRPTKQSGDQFRNRSSLDTSAMLIAHDRINIQTPLDHCTRMDLRTASVLPVHNLSRYIYYYLPRIDN